MSDNNRRMGREVNDYEPVVKVGDVLDSWDSANSAYKHREYFIASVTPNGKRLRVGIRSEERGENSIVLDPEAAIRYAKELLVLATELQLRSRG